MDAADDVCAFFDGGDVDFDEGEFAGDDVVGFEFCDFDDVDEFVELFDDLVEGFFVGVDGYGDAGEFLVFGGADGDAVDVKVASAEEVGDVVQDAGFVFDYG